MINMDNFATPGAGRAPRRSAEYNSGLLGLQFRTCASFIIFLLGILLWVLSIVYGSPISPRSYSLRHSESVVENFHDGYDFDKIDFSVAKMALVPVTVEVISRTPPLTELPTQIEYRSVDLGTQLDDYFQWYFLKGTRFSVYWHTTNTRTEQGTCTTRVVLVKSEDALKDLQKDHAPASSLVLFDTASADHQSTVFTIEKEDNYFLYFSNEDYIKKMECTTDFVMTLNRMYYDVTQLRGGERGSIYTFPIGQNEQYKTITNSPSYPLVMLYTPRDPPPVNGTVSTDLTVSFKPDRRFNVSLLICFIILGFLFVVGGAAVMVLTIQKTMRIRKELQNCQGYAPYARFT